MSATKPSAHESGSLAGGMHDIFRGAELNDFAEVDAALFENPLSIIAREPLCGLTALHVAAGNGSLGMVRHLLTKESVDPTVQDYLGRDALSLAISIGHAGIVDAIAKILYPKSFLEVRPPSGSIPTPTI